MKTSIPIIDLTTSTEFIAAQIHQACRTFGFVYIVGHGVDERLQQNLENLSRQFFAQDEATKMKIKMSLGGKAWRGYFPVGDELTSGQPDLKEGIYFGEELTKNHPMVIAQTPLHGANLFPDNLPNFKETILEYLAAMTALGHELMRAIALSLELEENYFSSHYTADPLTLFRIFNYPVVQNPQSLWGVGEHTDYGLLTILKQDDAGGLQVKTPSGWIEAPPVPNSFVCNIGDMLDRLTNGFYRSTPHRVRNISGRNRLSFPFFFDPNWNAKIQPLHLPGGTENNFSPRWDEANLQEFQGTYSEYLLRKTSKVFPYLHEIVL
jgi:isopenicillin N synthase-like dioxygenase